MRPCKAAIVQAAPAVFDIPATLEKIEKLASEAAGNGADLVLFPEAFLPGFPSALDWGGDAAGIRLEKGHEDYERYWRSSITEDGPEAKALSALAKRLHIHLVMGCMEKEGGTLYCTVLFFSPDGILFGKRRKVMPTNAERLIWGRGDGSTLKVHETALGKMGAIICWENYMPLLRASFFAQHIEIYLAPTADDLDTWVPSMQHIALEGRCYVLSACPFTQRKDFPKDYLGFPSDAPDFIISRGGSCIIDPFGTIIAGPVYNEEDILYAQLDPAMIAKGKYYFDPSGHYSRPDIFKLEVNHRQLRDVEFVDRE